MNYTTTKNTTFSVLPIGTRFECNGNVCIKRSTRTAVLVQYGRVFYFHRDSRVTIKH